ncbi:MAG: GntR family transcriptional regulator [Clostridia bacterium]
MDDYNLSSALPKILKHVEVYNSLYSMIKDGTFPVGSQLPSEPELAKTMNVSRMTLRRSLALLQEDDLITLVRGKGNFIKNSKIGSDIRKLTGIQHPLRACCEGKYDDLELEFRIEIPSDFMTESIQQKTAAIIIADRWYKKDGKVVAYSLSFIPIETISANGIDLNQNESLKEYLEETVYTIASTATNTFSYSTTGNFTASKHKLSEHNSFMMIQDNLYDGENKLIVYTKHFIPIDKFKIQISLTQGKT